MNQDILLVVGSCITALTLAIYLFWNEHQKTRGLRKARENLIKYLEKDI